MKFRPALLTVVAAFLLFSVFSHAQESPQDPHVFGNYPFHKTVLSHQRALLLRSGYGYSNCREDLRGAGRRNDPRVVGVGLVRYQDAPRHSERIAWSASALNVALQFVKA